MNVEVITLSNAMHQMCFGDEIIIWIDLILVVGEVKLQISSEIDRYNFLNRLCSQAFPESRKSRNARECESLSRERDLKKFKTSASVDFALLNFGKSIGLEFNRFSSDSRSLTVKFGLWRSEV